MLRLSKRYSGLLQQLRGYAATSEAAVVERDVFTRYASPFPAQLNLTPALAQLPETKVTRGGFPSRRMHWWIAIRGTRARSSHRFA